MRRLGAALVVTLAAGLVALDGVAASAAGPSEPRAPLGYWMTSADGGVFSFGQAPFRGSMGGMALRQPIVGLAASPSGKGYWLAASDGGIFAFGAPFKGSAGGIRLARPVVGMAATPSGQGYWLVASDGGVFSFGDASFFGSTGGTKLNSPIVAIAPTPTGGGYWLVASDGGLFSFGDATFFGSTGSIPLVRPIVSVAPTPTGGGYWLVASDGGVFSFGDAQFHGSTGGLRLTGRVVSLAPTPSGRGYWLASTDGGVFTFGDAAFFGALGDVKLASPILGLASLPNPGRSVSIFYYPWYGTPARDGAWRHWEQNGHLPPDDIGAGFYPSRGAYSSSDRGVIDPHMADVARAGIDEVATSWWGRGSFEDQRLPDLFGAARAQGLSVAVQIEPYGGRNVSLVANDIAHLRSLGVTDFYIYLASLHPAEEWAAMNAGLPGVRVFAHGGSVSAVKGGSFAAFAGAAGFTGIYTYDPFGYLPGDFARVCASARLNRLRCAPSVAPGYDARRATSDTRVRPRAAGATYDAAWQGAIDAGADAVTITSYNEWHEGTQIEPAVAGMCLGGGFCYQSYDGAFSAFGTAAETAYVDRTAFWVSEYR